MRSAEGGLIGYAVSYNRRHRRHGHLFLSEAASRPEDRLYEPEAKMVTQLNEISNQSPPK
jgi:hypothetical protein